MVVPSKYLFYDGLPNAKDIKKIMADNGYQSPYNTQVDTSNYHPIDDVQVHAPAPNGMMSSGEASDRDYQNWVSQQNPQFNFNKSGGIDVAGSVGAAPSHGMKLTFNKPPFDKPKGPNGIGEYVNMGLGIADSLIPGEKIHTNYVTQPLPTYNPYQYGTGSQAIMDSGGYVFPKTLPENNQFQYFKENTMPKGYTLPEGFDNGGVVESEALSLLGLIRKGDGDNGDGDKKDAASGIHINPANKGKFNATKKKTGKSTEELTHSSNPVTKKRAIFAQNAAKWHHENGGELIADSGFAGPGDPILKQIGGNGELATPQSRTDAYLLDDINKTLISKQRMKNTGYAPDQQKLLTDAYIWRSKNPTLNSDDAMKDYFDQQVDQKNPMHMMRAKLGKIGYGPQAMYNNTPNMDVQNPNPTPSTMANGGFVAGSIHDLPEEQIAQMLKSGYRFEHFKD